MVGYEVCVKNNNIKMEVDRHGRGHRLEIGWGVKNLREFDSHCFRWILFGSGTVQGTASPAKRLED